MIDDINKRIAKTSRSATPEEKARWVQGARDTMDKMRVIKEPSTTEFQGLKITTLPNVFPQRFFTDSLWFASRVPQLVEKKRFLEIGTGNGITALIAAKNGAPVVATDINPDAVKNARLNFEQNHLAGSIREGDVFDPIRVHEKFDVIFWNHPFHNVAEPPRDMLERSGLDQGYNGLKRYMSEGPAHLTEGGLHLLGTGHRGDMSDIEKVAEEYNRELRIVDEGDFPAREGNADDLFHYMILSIEEKK